jgi:naphthalene 1,2-dioxygenase ferredoxin component
MSQWMDVAAEGDLFEGAGIPVAPGGRKVALFLVEGVAYALENRCSHGMATIDDGFMEGHEVECSVHQGRFDVRTGAATAAPCTLALKTWPTKIEGGRVWVAMD